MDKKKLDRDLGVQFSSCIESKMDHDNKMIFNFNHDVDSLCDITDSSQLINQSSSQCVDGEIKEISDTEAKNLDIKNRRSNSVWNGDEYDLTEEQENLLLGVKNREGNSVWNDDEYDLTEEQENYLLNEDCAEHYIQYTSVHNLNDDYAVDNPGKICFVDAPSLLMKQSKMYDQQISIGSKMDHGNKMIFNFNHDADSLCYTTDSSQLINQSSSQCVDSEIKEISDTEAKNLDIKNRRSNSVWNGDECDLTEEQENLLLGIKNRESNSVWNDDEYDLTEEQENYLLNEDCAEHYIQYTSVHNLNDDYAVDNPGKICFADASSLLMKQSKMHDQQIRSIDSTASSNSNLRDLKKDGNLDLSDDKESGNVRNSLIRSNRQIAMENLRYNSGIKPNSPSYFSHGIGTEKNSGDVFIIKKGIISNTGGKEMLRINVDDGDSPDLYNKAFTKIVKTNVLSHSSSKNTLINSSMLLEIDEMDSNEESKIDVLDTSNGEFALSKVMNSDSARRVYLDLLRAKTKSLFISYNKYRNEFLENPSKAIDELELDKLFKKEENQSKDIFQYSKRGLTKLLDENTYGPTFDVRPLNVVIEKGNDKSTTRIFITLAEHSLEKTGWPTDPIQKANERSLRQSKDEIENKSLYQISTKAYNTDMDSTTFEAAIGENTISSSKESIVCIGKESASYDVTSGLESRKDNISKTFSIEHLQNVNMEDLCDLQKSNMQNQLPIIGKNITDGKVLNQTSQTLPGSKYTEILNSSLYMGYEAMDFQEASDSSDIMHCYPCENVISDTDQVNAPRYELNSHKKVTPCRAQKLKTKFSAQTLVHLFSLNNKIATNILSALLSKQFETGALLTDIMKYLRREMAIEIATKLRQDIRNFLKAATDAGIIQMKRRRYILTREKKLTYKRKTCKILCKNKAKATTFRAPRPKTTRKK